MWKHGILEATSEQLIKMGYEESELSGKMYEQYVKVIEKFEELNK